MSGKLDDLCDEDFVKLAKWGHIEDPFAAVKDFSILKLNRRWQAKGQLEMFNEYIERRSDYIKGDDFDKHYKEVNMPIERKKWEYLILRKAWYILPLGWDEIAKNGGKVADFGCGDGDTVQRLINFCLDYWEKNNVFDKTIHIVGIDLNFSRVENAKKLVETKDERITFEFHQGSIVHDKLNYSKLHFDYSIITAVFEILDDESFAIALDQVTSLTRKGIFNQDILDFFPGGFPRVRLSKYFYERDFETKKYNLLLTEPFSEKELQGPKKIFPNLLVQNLWLERII